MISLPAVIPAISEARVSMEIGQPPNPVTVTKAIGVSLGTWVDVLTSADANWQSGTWAAHLRFENSVGNSSYSLPGKPVIVPTVPTTPPPIIDPDPWGDWVDALPPNNTRNRVVGTWVDALPPNNTRNRVVGSWRRTGRVRENPVTLNVEEEQTRTTTWEVKRTRTTTWEKKQERTSQSGNRNEVQWVPESETETRWFSQSSTETQWAPCSLPDTDWSDTGDTRVDRRGTWRNTNEYRGSGANRERKQERTVYREKKQTHTRNCGTETQWVDTTSTTETRWVADPVVTHVWRFDEYTGCGPNRKRVEECTNGHTRHTRKEAAPEPLRWGRWYNTEHTRTTRSNWRDLAIRRGCGPDRERKQSRTVTVETLQERQSHCGNEETRWSTTSYDTEYQWVSNPEALRWGEWDDTGHQRENQVLLIIEKEQERTSHCGDTQTRWVVA